MKKLIILFAFALVAFTANAQSYLDGDMNHDGNKNVTDVMLLVDDILNGIKPPQNSYLTCPDDNHPHIIDLGLPSGTLWACCNVGADKPEAYGDHYAWGETVIKDNYTWANYIHCDGTRYTCHDLGNSICGTQYDAAHMKWGGSWQMPSNENLKELRELFTYEVVNINGVKGRQYTGPNGGRIFLPYAGTYNGTSIINEGLVGYYWTGTPVAEYDYISYYFHIQDGLSSFTELPYRNYGHSIRPIWVVNTPKPLELSESNVEINIGESITLEITLGNGDYIVGSANNNVATISLMGSTITVIGVAEGSVLMSVMDTMTRSTQLLRVTVNKPQAYLTCPDEHHPHLIDLGLPSRTLWACCNVSADKPEDYGGYFAWGETEEKTEYRPSNYQFSYRNDNGEMYDGNGYHYGSWYIGRDIAGTQYDVAHVKWGGLWQMPNHDQYGELVNKCSYVWTTINDINGGLFTGPNGGTIFLPAGGRDKHKGSLVGEMGDYWSSSFDY